MEDSILQADILLLRVLVYATPQAEDMLLREVDF
jgi:hypothetical protein